MLYRECGHWDMLYRGVVTGTCCIGSVVTGTCCIGSVVTGTCCIGVWSMLLAMQIQAHAQVKDFI